jgi:hypothetical protein
MAIQMDAPHPCGFVFADAYWRFNNFDQAPNRQADQQHSVPFVARFRPFKSQADFEAGKASLDLGTGLLDMLISFTPSSIGANLAEEAYAAFLAYDPSVDTLYALESAKDQESAIQAQIANAQSRLDQVLADAKEAGLSDERTEATEGVVSARAALAGFDAQLAVLQDGLPALQAEHDQAESLRTRLTAAVSI